MEVAPSGDSMKPHDGLSNPPIVEAILDVQCKPVAGLNLDKLATFNQGIEDAFPKRQARKTVTGRFHVGDDGMEASTGSTVEGYLFRSKDGSQVAQAKLAGFTFNQLQPYPGWDEFFAAFKEHWARYVDLTGPLTLTRVAVRTLNRIEWGGDEPLEAVLDTRPQLAEALELGVSGMFMALQVSGKDDKCLANVTEALEPGKGDDAPPAIVLDIDAYQWVDLPSDSTDEIEKAIESLRQFKNELFFESLTDATLERYR